MDFCRNVSVSGGLPSDYPPEQGLCLSPPFPQHEREEDYTSLDDLFPCHNTCEGDVNLEWLSVFVEDCLTSTGNCIPAPKANISNTTKPQPPKPLEKPHHNPLSLQDFSVPGKARSKRRRSSKSSITTTTTTTTNPLLSSWHMTTSDPPLLLHQAYWLADSELIVTSKNDENNSTEEEEEEEEGMDEKIVGKDMSSGSLGSITEGSVGQPRRCTHCLSQRTPQWRAGPLGPKTLCNACGVRFKSGRLLPEYRPAKSPTFVSFKHSNSHKKVLEMRMSSN